MSEISIIGLGEAGKNVTSKFRGYSQYDVYTVDSEGNPDYQIPRESEVEAYEKDYLNIIPGLYEEVSTDKIIFVVSGPGVISAASLPLLQPFGEDGPRGRYSDVDEKEISILYIQPDIDFLSAPQKKRERVTRNVLMQMARSAVFEKMTFISNPKIEKILGGVPIAEYYERINEMIGYALNMYFYYQNTDPVFGNTIESDDICRLSTIGIITESEEEYFYPLKLLKEKEFYFGFPKEDLEKDTTLIRKLKKRMKDKREGEMDIAISYGIYEMDEDYHICAANTSVVQSFDFLEDYYERN